MATPSEQSSSRTKRVRSDSDASSGDPSVLDTKRRRSTQATDGFAQTTFAVLSDSENVLPLRRRVNPDSLAIRLPADLVRELNAFILPGHTEMPTFAVRKELQERYQIDRRHIYDYFHSKGLRVVKEDRISNLIRGRRNLPVPDPQARSQSPRPSEQAALIEPKRTALTSRVIAKLPVNRQRKTVKNSRPKYRGSSPSESVAIDVPSPQTYAVVNPLDHSNHFQLLENDSDCDSETLLNSLADGSPLLLAVKDVNDYCSQDMSGVSELRDSKTFCTPSRTSSPQKSYPNSFLPLNPIPPSQSERISFYNILNDSLGPPCGLQECVGTYKAHMAERSRLYFERLFPTSHLGRSKHHGVQSIGSTQPQTFTRTDPDSRVDFGVDFRKWLLPGKPSSGVQAISTPQDSSTALSRPLVLRQDNITSVCKSSLSSHEIHVGGATLDDLFCPLPPLDQEIIGSPVLRSKPAHSFSPSCRERNFLLKETPAAIICATHPEFETLPATAQNGSHPGLAVPISRSSMQNTYHLPTPSVFHLSLSLYNNHLAAMSSTTAPSESEKICDRRRDLSVRARPVMFKPVANIETGRTTSRSGRTRTTSAGGGI